VQQSCARAQPDSYGNGYRDCNGDGYRHRDCDGDVNGDCDCDGHGDSDSESAMERLPATRRRAIYEFSVDIGEGYWDVWELSMLYP
jgi:hypothetical protein